MKKQSKYPKYILLPGALALYFVVLAYMQYKDNGYHLRDDFAQGVIIEVLILVSLFVILRYQHKKQEENKK